MKWLNTALLLPLCASAATERIVRPDGDVDLIETATNAPIAVFRRELRNPGSTDREVRMVEFVRELPLTKPAREYRTLGVDGLKGAEAPHS